MNFIKRSLIVGAVAAALAFSGCDVGGKKSDRALSSGSIALSTDDSLIYAADTDNGVLNVVDANTKQAIATVRVGEKPSRIAVAPDDTIYVSNRGSRSVSVIRKGEWVEAMRLETGVEPTGMALSADGKTLFVASATSKTRADVGTLTAFDTGTLAPKWEKEVGAEPRGVAVIQDRVFVSLYKDGDIAQLDANTGAVISNSTSLYDQANASRVSSQTSALTTSTFKPRAMNDLITTPDGKRLFAPVVWAREDSIAVKPNLSGGYYAAGGPCTIGAVATAGLVTIDRDEVGAVKPQVDDLTACVSSGVNRGSANFPSTALAPRLTTGADPIQGPTVGITDPSGTFVFVVNRESSNVAVMPTQRRDGADLDYSKTGTSVRDTVTVGEGTDGIAMTRDGRKLFTYSQFNHRIDALTYQVIPPNPNSGQFVREQLASLASDTLSPDLAVGRRLFFSATDTRMSGKTTNVACSTCHLEGREDGHVWEFPDGPRQTPSLSGRHFLATAPYHWTGEFKTINDFTGHTIQERMGGSGLDNTTADKLDRYIDSLPAAENPFSMDVASLQRGRAAFEKAACASCHTGDMLTNNSNSNVGTLVTRGQHIDNIAMVNDGEFNVPSLAGLSRSAPYLHDGSERTIEARVLDNNNRHGNVASLTEAEKTDLIAYLKTL